MDGQEEKSSIHSDNFSIWVFRKELFFKNNIDIVRHKFLAEAKLTFFEQFLWKARHIMKLFEG